MKKPQKANKNIKKSREGSIFRTISEWEFIANQLKNSDLSSIEEFYLNTGIPKRTFYDAVEKHQCMKEAHEYAAERIGLKKLKQCEDKNLGMNTVLAFQLPHYLNRFKKDIEWRARLKDISGTGISPEDAQKIVQSVLQDFNKKDK